MTTLDKSEVQALRAEIDQALASIAAKHGMKFSLGTIRFDANQMRTKLQGDKLTVSTVAPNTNAHVAISSIVAAAALNEFRRIGVDPTKFYMINSGAVQFIDYKSRNHRYPYIVQRRDGKRFKISEGQARMSLLNAV